MDGTEAKDGTHVFILKANALEYCYQPC